jgi:predicted Zn-ribbon and HTH transcriptional regulator
LEVADIFRSRGPAWRRANAGHVSLDQLKVMAAIENCRTAALGGHVARCEDCAYTTFAYNSCRNRHCPKCQGAAAKEWLAAREADLLPVPYYHVVFTLPAPIADIGYQNKAVIYDLLFKVSAETMLTIAADPQHLGAKIGMTSVLHTWGSALTHHPHVHMIVPGGGISLDGSRWISCRPGFLLPVRVLSRLFRRLFLKALTAAHAAGRLSFFGAHTSLSNMQSFATFLARLRDTEWVVYSKRPFGGPEAVLAYLSRYTHRVAIANSRLIKFDQQGVTFKWKNYRIKGRDRYKVMTLATDEFIRRFLIHVLPRGFHRIRHYGLFAKNFCADNIEHARELLATSNRNNEPADAAANHNEPACPCCGGRMIIIEVFARGVTPRHHPTGPITAVRIDTS